MRGLRFGRAYRVGNSEAFLNDNGVYADVLIPTREEGYGLHLQPILEKFGTIDYDLLITVDCGISEADTIKT